jgi:hypothetical protein
MVTVWGLTPRAASAVRIAQLCIRYSKNLDGLLLDEEEIPSEEESSHVD